MAWRLHVVGLATSKENDANGCGFGRERWIPARAAAFFAFSPPRGSGLGARSPANPYYSVSFAPSFILFSLARGSGLGARSPANPYYSVPFAPSFILFSPARGAGLGARSSANPYYSVPFAPSPAHFSLLRPAAARLPAARGAPHAFVYAHK